MKRNVIFLAIILLFFYLPSCRQDNNAIKKQEEIPVMIPEEKPEIPISSDIEKIIESEVIINLTSDYFWYDTDAFDIANGKRTVVLPKNSDFKERDIQWRLINAYRMLGYEIAGIPFGETVDAKKMMWLDQELSEMEKIISTQADKLPRDVFGPSLPGNIPMEYAMYVFASIFDLFNASEVKYVEFREECLFSSLYPYAKGVFVDKGGDDPLNDGFVIQAPDLFGYIKNKARIAIELDGDSDYAVPSNFSIIAIYTHEMFHSVDKAIGANSNGIYSRKYCEGEIPLMESRGEDSPFVYDGPPGSQNPDDFISDYAAGLMNVNKRYVDFEDTAESRLAYIFTPEFFREKMKKNERLKSVYEHIKNKNYFGVEFSNPYLIGRKNFISGNKVGDFYQDNKIPKFIISDIIVYKKN